MGYPESASQGRDPGPYVPERIPKPGEKWAQKDNPDCVVVIIDFYTGENAISFVIEEEPGSFHAERVTVGAFLKDYQPASSKHDEPCGCDESLKLKQELEDIKLRAYSASKASDASMHVVIEIMAEMAKRQVPPKFIKFMRSTGKPCYIRLEAIESVSHNRIWMRNLGGVESHYDDILDGIETFEKALKEE